MTKYSGSCLCGDVKIAIDYDLKEGQVLCHCTDCEHTSGTGFSTNILVKDLTVTGATDYTSQAASGNPVTRTFCKNCGSSISHKSVAFGGATAVQTGNLFQEFKDVPVVAELFTKNRWSAFSPLPSAAQKETM